MHGAHACLVPINYFVASIFEYLQIHGKTHSSIRAADLRHLLLLLPFVLDNLLKDEVDKYNRDKAQGSDVLVDPSEELVMVAIRGTSCFVAQILPKLPEMCRLLQHRQTSFWACLSLSFHTKTKRGC